VIAVEEKLKASIKFKKKTKTWFFEKEFYYIRTAGFSQKEKKGKT